MGLPFVSVIVAYKNRRAMLAELLHSFTALRYPRDRFEVILIDDRSTDGAWEWLNQNVHRFPFNLRIFRNQLDTVGPATPRNIGIAASQADILAFTDSDCVVSSGWLDNAVSCFKPGVGLVQGKTLPDPRDPKLMFSATNIVLKVTGDSCNILYTREAILAAGACFSSDFIPGWPHLAMYGDDVDLAYRVKEAGFEAVFSPEALVYHHVVKLDFLQWLKRPKSAITGPFLVRRHPSIRKDLLYLRYFVNPMTALFDLAVCAVFAGWLIHPVWILLTLPFLAGKYIESNSKNPFIRLLRVGGGTMRSAVTFVALIIGTIRSRTVLL